jgi:iron complex outermembrane recepter protein
MEQTIMIRKNLLAGAALALFAQPARAQAASAQPGDSQPAAPAPDAAPAATDPAAQPAAPADDQPVQGDHHPTDSDTIVVTGTRAHREDVLSGANVVSGDTLERNVRPSIGETLARQPGVSATSFGPNASRPVLRGQQGERVRVLTDGIGSLDVSATSADHAVAINPLTADRIEVLRGPAALLFGSEAIGGVVNVIDARIPRQLPTEAFHVDGILAYGSAADERSGNIRSDIPLGGGFVAHLDVNYAKSGDLRIGSYVLSPALRAQALASPDPAIRALADLQGRLANTSAESSDLAAGLAWIGGTSNVGFSVNQYDNLYGVPIRYSLTPGMEAEAPRIDVHQRRADGRAEIGISSGFVESIRLRAGYSDYRHNELEAGGAIGTTFLSQGAEGRIELVQRRRGGFGGGFGVQLLNRDDEVIGDEKFLPPNRTQQVSLFGLESLDLGALRAEIGGRFEHHQIDADADTDLGNPQLSRSFDIASASAGLSYGLAQGVRLGVNLSRIARAPSAEELFANGPHAGTQAFEVGNPALTPERSWGLEGTLRIDRNAFNASIAVFHSWFDSYIYDAQTGAVRDELPVFETRQGGARYFGVEFEGSARVAQIGSAILNVDGVADYVEATVEDFGPAPRIPPLRMLGGIELQRDKLTARIEAEHSFPQDRTALNETPTDAFTLVNASLNWRPSIGRGEVRLTLSANNIFDVDARRHASFLKDYAPLPGRDLRATVHVSF